MSAPIQIKMDCKDVKNGTFAFPNIRSTVTAVQIAVSVFAASNTKLRTEETSNSSLPPRERLMSCLFMNIRFPPSLYDPH